MKIKKTVLLLFVAGAFQSFSFAQSGPKQFWLFVTHTQKINDRFNILADVQSRSEQNLNQINTLLLRTALAYNINDQHSIALGYAYKGDWPDGEEYEYEHRIYQQYQYEFKIKRIEVQLRGRFEQRFLQDSGTHLAMRARGFAAVQFPIYADEDFTTGLFAGLQNELFLNVLNRQYANGHLFDQNRPYVSIGYRFSEKIETSFDYGLMADQGEEQNTFNNVFRISLTTNF
ncbi:MAG: DUF2490 domain-containing protein [Pedobacter agri]|uniref:DUF2490 domain-containing protein n=1 Tax=Pedobacter sp. G11 TaxID=2482728 RepID=UPI00143D967A|nr:DUF2490 domain-containing protein [Pedobacter sp. G11]